MTLRLLIAVVIGAAAAAIVSTLVLGAFGVGSPGVVGGGIGGAVGAVIGAQVGRLPNNRG